MSSRQEALEHYLSAMKQGQKAYRSDVMHGRYPYPQVLEAKVDFRPAVLVPTI